MIKKLGFKLIFLCRKLFLDYRFLPVFCDELLFPLQIGHFLCRFILMHILIYCFKIQRFLDTVQIIQNDMKSRNT